MARALPFPIARSKAYPRHKVVVSMQPMNRRALIVATCLLGATDLYAQGLARDSAEIERDLPIELPGRARRGATADALYQAASLSKLVTAVAALRLVEQGGLALDRDVNEQLAGWRLPDSALTRGHPVPCGGCSA